MTQLSLFDWAEKQKLLTGLGGRCTYCLEYDNWLTTDYWSDEKYSYYTVQCQTLQADEEGNFTEFCKNNVEIIEEREI